MLELLKTYGIKPKHFGLGQIIPSEFESWHDTINSLEIKADHSRDGTPIALEWRQNQLECQDGHHRYCSALVNHESTIYAFVIPKSWPETKINKFWHDYNNR